MFFVVEMFDDLYEVWWRDSEDDHLWSHVDDFPEYDDAVKACRGQKFVFVPEVTIQ